MTVASFPAIFIFVYKALFKIKIKHIYFLQINIHMLSVSVWTVFEPMMALKIVGIVNLITQDTLYEANLNIIIYIFFDSQL